MVGYSPPFKDLERGGNDDIQGFLVKKIKN